MLLAVQFRETMPVLLVAGTTRPLGAPQARATVQTVEEVAKALSV